MLIFPKNRLLSLTELLIGDGAAIEEALLGDATKTNIRTAEVARYGDPQRPISMEDLELEAKGECDVTQGVKCVVCV
jgi:hypothetical protein